MEKISQQNHLRNYSVNFRIAATQKILEGIMPIRSVLDVGCRNCEAKFIVPYGVSYFGNDLFQNAEKSVSFVGDILSVNFDRTFDCVMALDIVEHVDDPFALMDKLASLAEKHLIVSLPNIYDLLHKYDFVFRGTLGRKYSFGVKNSLDRHRWVMNYDEIHHFFSWYSKKHRMHLETKDIIIGERSDMAVSRIASRLTTCFLGEKTMTKTVIALFSK